MKKIKIKNSIFEVYLGVSDTERSLSQKVSMDLSYLYKNNQACQDDINDFLCYDGVIQKIRNFLLNKQFKTVEYLAEEVYFLIKGHSDLIESLKISIKKMHPPITCGNNVDAVVVKIGSK